MFCDGAESEEEQKECSVWAKKELQALFNTLYSAIYHDFPLPKNISPGDVHNMGKFFFFPDLNLMSKRKQDWQLAFLYFLC